MTTKRAFGSIRKLPSGRFQARYLGPDRVRYSAPNRFIKRADASKWLAGVETSISNGSWKSPAAPVETSETFASYAATWLPKRTLTPKTRQLYAGQIRRFLDPAFGSKMLTAITEDDVTSWWEDLSPDTPTQNAQCYSLLRTMLGGAKIANPCTIKGAGRVKRAREIIVLTPAEARALADNFPEQYRMLVLLTAFGCLRFGEGTELRRRNVVDGRLKITNGVTWVGGKSVVGKPKTEAGKRTVPLVPSLRPLLAKHILAQADPGDDGLLFPAARGGHLSHSSLTSMLAKAKVAIGRPELTWHHLRHTGAVMWAQDPNINLADLMALLGHESPEMALHYQHAVDGKLDAAAVKLDEHFAESALEFDSLTG